MNRAKSAARPVPPAGRTSSQGTGHIKRGKRRVKVCPRCKGRRRVQRRGSRIVHRLAFKVRDGQRTAAKYQEDSHGDS